MSEIQRSSQSHILSSSSGLLCAGIFIALTVSELPEAWALNATPTSLSFNAVQGGSNPPSQTVNVLKNNPHTVSWSTSDNATWLSVSPMTGTITNSAQISVSVNPAGLALGTYAGTVTVTASKGGSVSIPVTLTVKTGTSTSTGTSSSSNTATLSWSLNTETDLAGYKLYMGTASGVYSSITTMGKVTSYTISNLGLGTTYYFALTAYDTSGNESALSTEVSKSIY